MNMFLNGSKKLSESELQWMNEPPTWRMTDEQSLVVTAPPLADFFNDPLSGGGVASAPFLYTKFRGNFTATTRISVEMLNQCDSGCLIVMHDQKNWAKICFEFMNGIPTIVTVVTRSKSDDCNSKQVNVSNPYLRVARMGNSFVFHYSEDGINWEWVRYFAMDVPVELKVGLLSQSPFGSGCEVTFETFEISENHNEDIKVVK